MRDPSIAELDGVRALACIVVVLSHFDSVTPDVSFFTAWTALVTTLSGAMGLVCFFTLSGFLLTYLAVVEHVQTGRFDVRAFYVRRIFRIWPLHFVVVGIVTVLISPVGPFPIERAAFQWCLEHLWMYGVFLNNWSLAFIGVNGYVDRTPSMLNISWSIAIEEQIYLVFPMAMLAVLGKGRRQQVLVAAAMLAAGLGYRLLAYQWWGAFQSGRLSVLYFATPTYVDVVLAGGIAGWICARRRFGDAQAAPAGSGRSRAMMFLIELFAISFFWRIMDNVGGTLLDVVAYPLMGMVFGLGMLWVTESPGAIVARVLRWRPLRVVGTLSFSLYLWHFTGRAITHALFDSFRPQSQGQVDILAVATLVTFLAVSLLLATLSYALVERPFLQLRARLTTRGQPSGHVHATRRRAPGPPSVRLTTACFIVAAVGIGIAHLLVAR
jgi:peptidoglycan/LPS O-acetylase OafA/YrhL